MHSSAVCPLFPPLPAQAGLLPSLLPQIKMEGSGPFGVASFAISLLLVFRCGCWL